MQSCTFLHSMDIKTCNCFLLSYSYRVKSAMGHLDGRREFPRLCIGMYLRLSVNISLKMLIKVSTSGSVNKPYCSCYFIGIGNPPGTMDMKAFLLQKFSSVERKQVRQTTFAFYFSFVLHYLIGCSHTRQLQNCISL